MEMELDMLLILVKINKNDLFQKYILYPTEMESGIKCEHESEKRGHGKTLETIFEDDIDDIDGIDGINIIISRYGVYDNGVYDNGVHQRYTLKYIQYNHMLETIFE